MLLASHRKSQSRQWASSKQLDSLNNCDKGAVAQSQASPIADSGGRQFDPRPFTYFRGNLIDGLDISIAVDWDIKPQNKHLDSGHGIFLKTIFELSGLTLPARVIC